MNDTCGIHCRIDNFVINIQNVWYIIVYTTKRNLKFFFFQNLSFYFYQIKRRKLNTIGAIFYEIILLFYVESIFLLLWPEKFPDYSCTRDLNVFHFQTLSKTILKQISNRVNLCTTIRDFRGYLFGRATI